MMYLGYLIVIKKNIPYYYFAKNKEMKKLCVDDICYSGVGRSWDYWLPDKAPDSIKNEVRFANEYYQTKLTYKMFLCRESALRVLKYLNDDIDDGYEYELIGISQKIQLDLSMREAELDGLLGIDIDYEGLYPIKELLFASKIQERNFSIIETFYSMLNQNGLFSTFEEAKEFVLAYIKEQTSCGFEKMILNDTKFISIYKAEQNV